MRKMTAIPIWLTQQPRLNRFISDPSVLGYRRHKYKELRHCLKEERVARVSGCRATDRADRTVEAKHSMRHKTKRLGRREEISTHPLKDQTRNPSNTPSPARREKDRERKRVIKLIALH